MGVTDRIASHFVKPEKLHTERLLLRAMSVKDVDDMFEYACLPLVTRYLLWAPHESPSYTKHYLKRVVTAYRKGEFFDWGVELLSEKKFIGTCGIAAVDIANNRAEIGYVFNPKYWNCGYASEAVGEVIRYCFEVLDFNRVEARYMLGNDASRRVMEKCGMKFEGVTRGAIFVKDGYCDVGVCAVLASDYRQRRHII